MKPLSEIKGTIGNVIATYYSELSNITDRDALERCVVKHLGEEVPKNKAVPKFISDMKGKRTYSSLITFITNEMLAGDNLRALQ